MEANAKKEDYEVIAICKNCGEPTQIKYKDIEHIFPTACKCKREEAQRQAELEKKKKIEEIRQKVIATEKYRGFTFENDDMKNLKISKYIKKYVEKFEEIKPKGLGLLLFGNVGTGKTFYAYCIANALIDNGYNVATTTLTEVIKIAQNFDREAERNIYKILSNDVILIDDIGTERQTSFAYEQIFNFIDKATAYNKVLILTTNLTLEELESYKQTSTDISYVRIFSRILEKCLPVRVEMPDRRDTLKETNREYLRNLLKN